MDAERAAPAGEHTPREAELGPAWESGYTLLGRLYLEGPAKDLRPYLNALPELVVFQGGSGLAVDYDQLAADHQDLFGFNVFPFASAFLDPGGLLGGPVTAAVRAFYQEIGFPLGYAEESPDHLGQELRALAFLTGAEYDRRQNSLPKEADRRQGLLRRFLDTHLLRWLPALVLAVRARRMPLYGALADLTLDLVLAHRAALAGESPEAPTPFDLPPAPDLLADPGTRLKDIAAYWLTPAYSGLYLARADLARLAREHELPGVFGERQRMLADLFRTAADYDRLDGLLDGLQALVATWQAGYRDLALAQPGSRWLAPLVSPWLARLEASRALIERLRDAARNGSP